MFFLNKGFTNKRFQTDQMVNCTSFAPEATLEVSNKTVTFQKTNIKRVLIIRSKVLQRQLVRANGR